MSLPSDPPPDLPFVEPVAPGPEERSPAEFFVVGIGASAGGLDAISEVLKRLPVPCNLAVVIVQHLDPNHDSLLVELLSRVTPLPVHWAVSSNAIEAGHIYVAP